MRSVGSYAPVHHTLSADRIQGGRRPFFIVSVLSAGLNRYDEKTRCGVSRGGRGILSDAKAAVAILPAREETYRIGRWRGRHPSLSLFAVGGNAVVSISGALYEGKKITLEPSFPLGVSNRPESGCEVAVHEGRILLILEPGMPVRRPGTLFRAVGM